MHVAPIVFVYLHLVAAAFWVGGMATLHFAVRPAAAATLEPPQRLPFMAAALARFFAGVTIAIVVVLLSGLGLIWLAGGFARVPASVHAMFGVGLLMMALFLHIRLALFPRLRKAVTARDWPAGAVALAGIRRWVGVNLGLGVVVFALGLAGRAG